MIFLSLKLIFSNLKNPNESPKNILTPTGEALVVDKRGNFSFYKHYQNKKSEFLFEQKDEGVNLYSDDKKICDTGMLLQFCNGNFQKDMFFIFKDGKCMRISSNGKCLTIGNNAQAFMDTCSHGDDQCFIIKPISSNLKGEVENVGELKSLDDIRKMMIKKMKDVKELNTPKTNKENGIKKMKKENIIIQKKEIDDEENIIKELSKEKNTENKNKERNKDTSDDSDISLEIVQDKLPYEFARIKEMITKKDTNLVLNQEKNRKIKKKKKQQSGIEGIPIQGKLIEQNEEVPKRAKRWLFHNIPISNNLFGYESLSND